MKNAGILGVIVGLGAICGVDSIVMAQDVEAGPIWSNEDAQLVCPAVCGSLVWDGNWHTTEPGVVSVCRTTTGNEFEVGPIWSNEDAQTKCPVGLGRVVWSGQWQTVVPGEVSECGCESDLP